MQVEAVVELHKTQLSPAVQAIISQLVPLSVYPGKQPQVLFERRV